MCEWNYVETLKRLYVRTYVCTYTCMYVGYYHSGPSEGIEIILTGFVVYAHACK